MSGDTQPRAGAPAHMAEVSPHPRFFEDFLVDETFDLGIVPFSRDDIVGFAAAYDPQPFHLDEAAGAASLLGGLAASGWHAAAVLNRALADAVLAESAALGPAGVARIGWRRPVRAGDRLAAMARVVEVARPPDDPARGIVRFLVTASDSAGEVAVEIDHSEWIEAFARP